MEHSIKVNTQITNSIPLEHNFKRYFISWFKKMCECNGTVFAVRRVKEMRELLMQYISDPHHKDRQQFYASKAPIRKNKRLMQAFSYSDTNPIEILAFFKFYLGEAETIVSVEESQDEMHRLLSEIDHQVEIPSALTGWLACLRRPKYMLRALYTASRKDARLPYHYVCLHHSLDDWMQYWTTWKGRLLKAAERAYKSTSFENMTGVVPVPSIYADAKLDPYGQVTSEQFWSDIDEFLGLFPACNAYEEVFPVDILDWLISKQEPSKVFNLFELDEIEGDGDGTTWSVGQIHHIPKKGTVGRRPIAVPNRFLQQGMLPYQRFLYKILRGLPRDHTFDQTKSSHYVKHRLDHGHYTCSVDLSHATDYLPKEIADYIVDAILPKEALSTDIFSTPRPNEDFVRSRQLFDFMSRAQWRNGEHLDSWKVGQPLGTLPSFGTLALEHNILLESLALYCGYLHSPYTVLGDDVLLFSKRMRRAYITLMEELGVPLSIHKSYEHNLVEFAGQILIKNHLPAYTPDPAKVSWYNLFDYSRNSGIQLSYRELPSGIRKKLTRLAHNVSLSGSEFFRAATECYSAYYSSPRQSYMLSSMRFFPYFVEALESTVKVDPEPALTSGWSVYNPYGDGERLIFTGRAYERKLNDQSWFKQKYKPLTTNAIIAFTMRAVEGYTRDNLMII